MLFLKIQFKYYNNLSYRHYRDRTKSNQIIRSVRQARLCLRFFLSINDSEKF